MLYDVMCLHGTLCWENLAQSFLSLQDNKDSTAPDTAAQQEHRRYWENSVF